MSMIGKEYLEHGRRVTVLIQWRPSARGPRNVLVRRHDDGSLAVRPAWGLRLPPERKALPS